VVNLESNATSLTALTATFAFPVSIKDCATYKKMGDEGSLMSRVIICLLLNSEKILRA